MLPDEWMRWFDSVKRVWNLNNLPDCLLNKYFLNSATCKSSLLSCCRQKSSEPGAFVSHDVVCCLKIHLQPQNDFLIVLFTEKPPLWMSIILLRQHFDVAGWKAKRGSCVGVTGLTMLSFQRLHCLDLESPPFLPWCYPSASHDFLSCFMWPNPGTVVKKE